MDHEYPNLDQDVEACDWICAKIRARDDYAQNFYAALCNNEFQRNEVWPILKNQTWGCTWRYAGGIVAYVRDQGDYIDWYCSGLRSEVGQGNNGYVSEGYITDEVRKDLLRLGWIEFDPENSD
jgi:hypothetical protein